MLNQPIVLKNVTVHNLKGVDLILSPGQLIVFTGVSGSGKSSLAFDTIYVEGQRRYIESLSTYARRYMGNLTKPDADLISGISPTIAIEQKTAGKTPRSTVGTITGIYDFLRVLYARVGIAHCPVSGEQVAPQSKAHIISTIEALEEKTPLIFLAPYVQGKKGEFKELSDELIRKGFMRIRIDGEIVDLSEKLSVDKNAAHDIDLVVDRIIVSKENAHRITEAVSQSLELGDGLMSVLNHKTGEEMLFSEHAYAPKSGFSYSPLEPHDFSFNHPKGMCPTCEGLGKTQDFDLGKIIDDSLSIAEDPCSIAGSYQTVKWGNIYNNLAKQYKFRVDTPWNKLSKQAQKVFLYGVRKKWLRMKFVHPKKKTTWTEYVKWRGVLYEAKSRLSQATSESYRTKMKALMHETTCPDCQGSRIRPYPSATTIGNKTIHEMTQMTVEEAEDFFHKLRFTSSQQMISQDLILEIQKRLEFLLNVGLYYLTINRTAPTLSGGEAQRVRLASQIGSGLVGTTYILDEPSIGLHPRDNTRLIKTLQALRDRGNTVIVVEHDEETMEAADVIVDIGPGAGTEGGKIVAKGSIGDLICQSDSLTGHYLGGKLSITLPQKRRQPSEKRLRIIGAQHHNLKQVNVEIPLGCFVAVTGVSGSGKSSLISDTLHPALAKELHRSTAKVGKHKEITGISEINKVIAIDQSPIGRTPRSNPSTYIKVFDDIRDLFAKLPESAANGFKPGHFSFNVEEGSCTKCKGMGMIRIDMDFLDDVWSPCSLCQGKRFDLRILAISFRGKTIHDVLEMTVEEALTFFTSIPTIHRKLKMLSDVGLDYLTLGQSSTTLSGGEAQRIKLSREIIRPGTGKTLYILDEPTTGLHFHDVKRLIDILQHLVEKGNTVLVIEHNMDLVKTVDWVIDLGPEGGKGGGLILGYGPPEELARKKSSTGVALKHALSPKHHKQLPIQEKKHQDPLTIDVRGCTQNNLKNLSLSIPRGKISICTGPSGSGKSSFAFETVYAEGQRRYIDSLSSYARQFVQQMPKPKVESIEGLSPAIAIEQKKHAGNPRSTVGTMTEIYDYLRLLYANLGTAYCPETGEKIEAISKESVTKKLMTLPEKTKLQILVPIPVSAKQGLDEITEILTAQGFLRIRLNGEYYELDSEIPFSPHKKNALFLVVDRIAIRKGVEKRLLTAIADASKLTDKPFIVATPEEDLLINLSFAVPSTGQTYPPLTPHTFSFNAEEGMCLDCSGLGYQWGANLLQHQKTMSLSSCKLMEKLWREEITDIAEDLLLFFLEKENIDPDTPLYNLPVKQLQILLHGNSGADMLEFQGMQLRWCGINKALAKAAKAGHQRIKETIKPFLEETPCLTCHGERLNPLARHVKLGKKTLGEFCRLPLSEARSFITKLKVPKKQSELLKEIFEGLKNRLQFLCEIGLDYISLERSAPTLSGGETQRIHLARQLGSGLTGCLYVLDEPTIGLHPHNNARLNRALKELCHLDNTILMVEHDPQTLQAADTIFDFGPCAGNEGGRLMAEGTLSQIKKNPHSLTGAYLSGRKTQPRPIKRRAVKGEIVIENASTHNLKNISVAIPTRTLTCVTGVSGSGKSTLIHNILKKGVERHLASHSDAETITVGPTTIRGVNQFNKLISIDQKPIGHTIRADVSTYCELSTPIRQFYASLPEAKARGLLPKHFSYNHLRGMCRSCWGLGFRTIKLQFLPSLKVTCDACHGNRLNPLSLKARYKGKNLGELLKLSLTELKEFFPPLPKLIKGIDTLIEVGLGYLNLGQEIATLSGGEAGRLRLSRELAKRSTGKTLYLFDEPTIGLHSDDIAKLLPIFHTLVDKGNSVIIIEHNLDVIQSADYLIDLGPDGGSHGGELVATGTPEEVAKHSSSYTASYLTPILLT